MASSKRKQQILAVGLSFTEVAHLASSLEPEDFDVEPVRGAQDALDVARRLPVDALLVRYPLPDMVLQPFLRTIRDAGGSCRNKPLLLLADRERCIEAERYLGRGANRILPFDTALDSLGDTLTHLANVAPRRRRQFIAQLWYENGNLGDWLLCRSENSSASGALLATERYFPTGVRVDFELTLPAVDRAVVGRAEVARHTLAGRERVRGMGLRYLSFAGRSQRVYESFLGVL